MYQGNGDLRIRGNNKQESYQVRKLKLLNCASNEYQLNLDNNLVKESALASAGSEDHMKELSLSLALVDSEGQTNLDNNLVKESSLLSAGSEDQLSQGSTLGLT
ncbi:hypothetical protein ACLKA7_015059 [Drosophila subpalustris]